MTSRSASGSTKREVSEYENVYQLPAIAAQGSEKVEQQEEAEQPAMPEMRFDYLEETFDFPLPDAILPPTQVCQREPTLDPCKQLGQPASGLDRSRGTSYSTSAGSERPPPSRTSQTSSGKSGAPSRAATTMSIGRKTTSSQSSTGSHWRERDENAEIEMASREQYGYWRASFTGRIPPSAAICGAWLLAAKLPSRHPKSVDITCDDESLDIAADFCLELEQLSSPEQTVQFLQTQNLEGIIKALKASFDGLQRPKIPDKIAVQMFRKIAEAKEQPRKKENLWSQISKLLSKIPQDILVLLMFRLSISKRLQSRNISIDGQDPAISLLRNMFPTSLALSQDQTAGESVSKLLITHFDEIPGDMPLVLEAVNCSFGRGRKCNILDLMGRGARRKMDVEGPGGVREIDGVGERVIEW